MWFLFALLTMLAWGGADLFYKKGADERDRFSHLKTAMTVGFVMGLHAIATLLFSDVAYDFRNLLIYLPVSLCYILSMTVGYLGLRYLELSISSPIQNASGAVTCILCLVILGDTMDALTAVGVIVICAGVILLGALEKTELNAENDDGTRKYRLGFAAFFLPVLYCVIDALGTFLDAFYLDDWTITPLRGVTEETFEDVANLSYELTFFLCAIVIFVYLILKKQPLFVRPQGARFGAAVLETAGQFTYVYAMAGNGAVAAPMIAAYCIVSIALSRVFLREKLAKKQYAVVIGIVVGIGLIGIAEGLAA